MLLFVKTLILELPLLMLFFNRSAQGWFLLVFLGANLLSHPLAMHAFHVLGMNFWLVELLVVALESLLFWLYLRKYPLRVLVATLLANSLSALFFLLERQFNFVFIA